MGAGTGRLLCLCRGMERLRGQRPILRVLSVAWASVLVVPDRLCASAADYSPGNYAGNHDAGNDPADQTPLAPWRYGVGSAYRQVCCPAAKSIGGVTREAGKPKFLDIHDRANLEFTWTYPNCLLRPKAGKVLQETGLAEGRSGEVY